MIFLKDRSVKVDFYTSNRAAYEIFPVEKASAAKPDLSSGELRRCIGLQNLYKQGFVMPLWTDIRFEMKEVGDPLWQAISADEHTRVVDHPNQQFGKVIDAETYQNFKIMSPWAARCDEDIKFLTSPLLWEFNTLPENTRILNGVSDFKYQHSTNFIFLCKKEKAPTDILLRCGTPLYQFIPLTERKVDIRLHLVSPEQWHSYSEASNRISFDYNYLKVKSFLSKRK